MLESRAFSVEEICRFFGVPPFMIGHTEKSTSWGTGLEQQTLGFQKFTLRRRLKRIEQALEKQLLTPKDRAQGVTIEFNLEGLLRGDSKPFGSSTRRRWATPSTPDGWFAMKSVRWRTWNRFDGWDEPIPLISQRERRHRGLRQHVWRAARPWRRYRSSRSIHRQPDRPQAQGNDAPDDVRASDFR
jgi:hypothetical protein